MADPNHYGLAGPFSISELSRHIGAEIAGAAKAELVIVDVRSLEDAEPNHLSFLTNKRYTDAFRQSRAGAAIVGAGWASDAPDGMTLLVSEDPHLAFAKTTRLFYPPPRRRSGISPSAIIEENAILGDDVWIAPHAVIGTGARIGSGTKIGANSVIGDYAIVGKDCDIEANVTLSHCVIGDRVTIYPGVRIGQDGFGFATDRSIGDHLRIPQVGLVIIGNGASIGSNTTIDRGSGPDTIIGPGCMIDNLVQIGHNVVLGRGCVLAAQSGVAGSTKLGDFVMVGGQVGLAGHINIGSAAKVAGKSGVMQDVPPRAIIGGIPAVPMVQWLRHNLILEKLARRRDK